MPDPSFPFVFKFHTRIHLQALNFTTRSSAGASPEPAASLRGSGWREVCPCVPQDQDQPQAVQNYLLHLLQAGSAWPRGVPAGAAGVGGTGGTWGGRARLRCVAWERVGFPNVCL